MANWFREREEEEELAPTLEEIERLLDDLMAAKGEVVRREIAMSSSDTKANYMKAREARVTFQTKYQATVQTFVRWITNT